MSKSEKICLIGYSVFQETVMQGLMRGGQTLSCVATQMEDPDPDPELEEMFSSRGLRSSLSDVARESGVPYLLFDDLNSDTAISAIKRSGASVVLSCSAPILRRKFIESFDSQVFNLHGSLRYRGRAASSWLLLSGTNHDSVVLHRVDTGIDTGEHVAERRFEWDDEAYPIDVTAAQRPSFSVLSEALGRLLSSGQEPTLEKSPSRPYYPALSTPLDGWIDWTWDAEQIERAVRAFGWPYDGAATLLEHPNRESDQIHVARSQVLAVEAPAHPLMIGCVVGREAGAWVDVQCGNGVLRIQTLRDGLREEAAGRRVKLGCRLRSPLSLGTDK